MPTISKSFESQVNGFTISVFEVDILSDEQLNLLKTYLKNRIKKIRLFREADQYADLLSPPNLNKKFSRELKQRIKEICTPREHKIKWFDVRRSIITEFMAQLLLEKNYKCLFFEEADKRINITPDQVDKHAPGIDVTGIQNQYSEFKFVVCEVKASRQQRIPCDSAAALLEDMQKAKDDKKRVTREILQYLRGMNNLNTDSPLFKQIIEFLAELIQVSDSFELLYDRLVFFPFLIRQNQEIIEEKNTGDFINFKKEDFPALNMNGVIWSFNENIDDFSKTIYEEALNDL